MHQSKCRGRLCPPYGVASAPSKQTGDQSRNRTGMSAVAARHLAFRSSGRRWQPLAASNRGPSLSESDALPTELSGINVHERGPHDRTRTCIHDIRNVALIQLSYVGIGASDGIRTRVAALRGQIPGRWKTEARRFGHSGLRKNGSRRRFRTCLRRLTTGSPHRDGSTGIASRGWWSQTESNRRHPACKAGALPSELWPRNGAQGWDRTTDARAFNAPLYR